MLLTSDELGAVRTSSRFVSVAGVLSAIFSVVFILRASFVIDGQRYFTLFDDALVSMRYARNLAEGHGLVWNAGEPAVEGYTNFLWTLWMALLHLLRVPDRLTSLLVSLSGAAIVIATALVAARLARGLAAHERPEFAAGATAIGVALCYPLLFWTLRGMEVGLMAFLVAAGVTLVREWTVGDDERVGLLACTLGLMTLVRPDGVLPAILIGMSAVAGSRDDARRRRALVLCAVPLLVFAVHTAVRFIYYGSPLPNTYYLKMTGAPAAVRIARGLDSARGALPYVLIPFVMIAANRRFHRDATTALVITVPTALLAYTVYVGGDAWEWMPHTNRYLTPALPLLLAGAAATTTDLAERFAGRWRTTAAIAAGLVIAASVSAHGFLDWARTGGSHVRDDANMVWFGVRVGQTTTPDTRIGVVWAGAIPYFSRRPAVDFLGKSDAVIARHAPVVEFLPGHDKFDYDYSIGRLRPDLVTQLWFPTDDLFRKLPAWGYERVFGGVFAQHGAGIDVARLREAFNEPPIP